MINLSNLSPVTGSPRKEGATIGSKTVSSTPRVAKVKVVKISPDIKYLGEGTFRFTSNFVKTVKALGEVGVSVVSDPTATLATVNEAAFKVVSLEDAKYLGTARTGVNPKTKEVVQGKPSTLITNKVLEAFLINTNQLTKDVKAEFTLSQVVSEGTTYFVFGQGDVQAESENAVESNEVEETVESDEI